MRVCCKSVNGLRSPDNYIHNCSLHSQFYRPCEEWKGGIGCTLLNKLWRGRTHQKCVLYKLSIHLVAIIYFAQATPNCVCVFFSGFTNITTAMCVFEKC